MIKKILFHQYKIFFKITKNKIKDKLNLCKKK